LKVYALNKLESLSIVRNKLKTGGYSVGGWMQIPHPSIAEIMGDAGYDWIAIDMEHGSISISQLPDLFRALELGNTLPIVRVAHGQPKDCKQALDAGASGIIVPMVETAEQLMAIQDDCRWPPAGHRGVGFSRANLFGKKIEAYGEEAQAPLLVAMIESLKALDNLDSILLVEGLDAIMVGPYDLSASMGIPGEFEKKEYKDALERVKKLCIRNKVSCGIHVIQNSKEELEGRIREGYGFIAYSLDAVFLINACTLPS